MSTREEVDIEGLGRPLAMLVAGIVLGGIALFSGAFSGSTAYMRWVFLAIGGVLILYPVIGAYARYREEGLSEAVDWMAEANDSGRSSRDTGSGQSATEKVPPPAESKKNELYFDRADQKCEWCGERVDSPDVHHIQARADGGSNDPRNLIVLCPSCHRKADNDAISKSKLRGKVQRQMEAWEGS